MKNLLRQSNRPKEAQENQGRIAISPGLSTILFQIVAAIFAVVVFMGVSGCSGDWNVPPAAKEMKNLVPSTPQTLADARKIYLAHCAHCHGVNGDGKRPPGSTYLYLTQPTRFTDSKIMDAMSDGEVFWKITNGNRPMPSYRDQLSDEDRWKLVDFLRTFAHPSAAKSAAQPH